MKKLKKASNSRPGPDAPVRQGRSARHAAVHLVQRLVDEPNALLGRTPSGDYRLTTGQISQEISKSVVRPLVSSGVLVAAEDGLTAGREARAWLRRWSDDERPFLAQHQHLETLPDGAENSGRLVDRSESPVAGLARHNTKGGEPWLAPHLVAAADRLRRDFELGQLQPRITASWSASINMDRRSGNAGGLANLTDMALAARVRLDGAIKSVGPEFAGLLLDACCFLKGLETVERERLWPARSAKLVLRLGLEALARHYGLAAEASGNTSNRKTRHWGAEGYRPEIS